MAQKTTLSSLLTTVAICGLSFMLSSLLLFVNFPESRPHLHRIFDRLPMDEYEPILNKLKFPDEAVELIRHQWTQLNTVWLKKILNNQCAEHKYTTTTASDEPYIVQVNGFLTAQECEALIKTAKPKLADDTTASSLTISAEDFKCITERVVKVVSKPNVKVESGLVTRYKKAQDAEHTQQAGWTLLVYLNENGGKATAESLSFEPKVGDAVLFAGGVKLQEKAKDGEKWIAKWHISQ